MTFNTVSSLSIVTLMVWLLVAPHPFAQAEAVPPDVFEARPDGYLYADYPGVFDAIEDDGITVEAWIYLTERPEDRVFDSDSNGKWLILAKPGSYFITFSGRALNTGFVPRPEGTTIVGFVIVGPPGPDSWGAGTTGRVLKPQNFPLARWVHIAFQIKGDKRHIQSIGFYDRTRLGISGDDAMGRTEAPLLIGGPKLVSLGEGFIWNRVREYESMKGYIDAVRISAGFRYSRGAEIRPKRHFRADAQTIALWRFEEGPGAPVYRDSSGNNYTLFAGGSLAVHPGGKVATTWGSLKRGTF